MLSTHVVLSSHPQDEDVLDTWFSSGLFPFSGAAATWWATHLPACLQPTLPAAFYKQPAPLDSRFPLLASYHDPTRPLHRLQAT